MLGFWSFDEAMGTELLDLSDNLGPELFVEDDSIATVPTWDYSEVGSALHFDGESYAKISDFYCVGGSAPRTIAFWMKTGWQIDSVLVGEASGDLDPDLTGANGAVFGRPSASFAAGGENTVLDNGVEFASGTINLGKRLQMDPYRLFTSTETPVDFQPEPGGFAIDGVVRTDNGLLLRRSGAKGTVTVEHSLNLKGWLGIASDQLGSSFEDTDAGRFGGEEGYYRMVIP